MTKSDEELMCYFCSNSPEDIFETLFNAWSSESVEPEEMGLDKGKKAMRKTHLKHKFEDESEKNKKMIEDAKLAKEDAAKVLEQIEKDLEDDSWKFEKKDHPEFGPNVYAVPALKYINDDETRVYGDMSVTAYRSLKDCTAIPENVDKILKIMSELEYNNNLKSFIGDLKYTKDRVRNYKLIMIPEELTLAEYMKNEFVKADPYPYKDVKVFGETVSICPMCIEIFKKLQQ